jgi:L,D-transpeptidase YbiS
MNEWDKSMLSSCIEIDIAKQQLRFFDQGNLVLSYTIASATNGVGELSGSECTPRGKHIIRAKIGYDAPINSVFVGRRQTGEIYKSSMREEFPKRDWILTRIMWLSGCEVGKNRLHNSDTMRRYIYIHGCPDEDVMGTPSSHGCIKMRNSELIELFDHVKVYTPVLIN